MPKAPALVYEDDLTVAEWLSIRKKFPVMAILEALQPLMQPGLIKTQSSTDAVATAAVNTFAPMPLVG
jgi:hypothetical protein